MNKIISNKINLIRIISMFSIVLCHYLQYYNIYLAFWFNVGVQIFFIISAVLYGAKDIKDFKTFWKNKVFKLLIPYYIVLICYFFISYIFDKNNFSLLNVFYYFTGSQAFNTSISPIAHFWFISYILIFYMIIYLLQKYDISKDKNFFLKLLLIMIGIQAFQFLNIININASYLNLFISSYYLSRRYFKYKIKDNYKLIFIVSFIICLIGIPIQICFENMHLTNLYYKLFIVYHDYIHCVLGIVLFLLFVKILPSINNKYINYLSNISYYVYLVHQIFILGAFSLLKYKYGIGLSLIAIIIFSNLLYFLTQWTNHKFLNKKKL